MNDPIGVRILELVLTFFSAMAASSGLWIYLGKKDDRKDLKNRLLMGLAHDRIVDLAMKYIRRGWLSRDEYENLCVYLYEPYIEMNGNGSAKRLMEAVNDLPIRDKSPDKMENHGDEQNI